MWEVIRNGGPFMWPIFACSIVALAIALERWMHFVRLSSDSSVLVRELRPLIEEGRVSEARRLCWQARGPVAAVLAELLEVWPAPRERREEVVSVSGSRELRRMEKRLRGLAVIGRTAPLLGLLGTVVGLVEAFMAVSAHQGRVDPSILAGGIWQALLTTVAGLVVAIPAILAHEWFESRVDEMAFAIREATSGLVGAEAEGASMHEMERQDDRVSQETEPARVARAHASY